MTPKTGQDLSTGVPPPPAGGAPEAPLDTLPSPQLVDPLGLDRFRLPLLPGALKSLGGKPKPTPLATNRRLSRAPGLRAIPFNKA